MQDTNEVFQRPLIYEIDHIVFINGYNKKFRINRFVKKMFVCIIKENDHKALTVECF